jgi:hypothetical protein
MFYDGNPTVLGTLIGEDTVDVATGGANNASVSWTGLSGTHEIYVVVSPYNSFLEKDYANNQAYESIDVNELPIAPTNVSPADGATGISLTPTVQSSAFSDPDVGDTHAASWWQITTVSGDYSSAVFDSGTDTSNLTSVTMPSVTLNYSTTYYWHVRHRDNHGDWSEWSPETSFTTIAEAAVLNGKGAELPVWIWIAAWVGFVLIALPVGIIIGRRLVRR